MKTYSISQLAKSFGLSRSTLLYYDRIGLLCASERTAARYRLYTQEQYERLMRISIFRSAGLSLSDIKMMLAKEAGSGVAILEKRLEELKEQIFRLRSQQHVIAGMLKKLTDDSFLQVVDKAMWINMLKAAGMDESAMSRWHAEFESAAPQAHHDFLLSLGIHPDEVRQIREYSKGTVFPPIG